MKKTYFKYWYKLELHIMQYNSYELLKIYYYFTFILENILKNKRNIYK